MIIRNEQPPNYEDIASVFDIKGKPVVFTFGNVIFNPAGTKLPEHLIQHEIVHCKQQAGNPLDWWNKYLKNDEFRLSQELEAYRVQYGFFCSINSSKDDRFKFLLKISKDLASEIYGKLCKRSEAMDLISGNGYG